MDPWFLDPLHMTYRLLLSVLLGGIIGLEREQKNQAAGFRTHILVCTGSTLIMLLSMYGFKDFADEPNVRLDPARLAAQVVSGIGFLGAGTIMVTGMSVKGLTTAASLWVVAAIGLAVGAGFYYPAVFVTIVLIISLWILNKVEKKLFKGKRIHTIKVSASDSPECIGELTKKLTNHGVEIRKIAFEKQTTDPSNPIVVEMIISIKFSKPLLLVTLTNELSHINGVQSVSLHVG